MRLNSLQREAVLHGAGPLLILAGPGTGKTEIILQRSFNLICEKNVSASQMLIITFSPDAASKIKKQFEAVLPGLEHPHIGTFYTICELVIRQHIEKTGCKNVGCTSEVLPGSYQMAAQRADVYAGYQEKLKNYSTLEFDDLLLLTVQLFEQHPAVLEQWQEQFQWLLVDEYQDINPVQYRLIRMLAGKRRNVCAVGDDDQSIYSWRGADIRHILEFEKDFPGAVVIRLEQNYRSTPTILQAAGAVVARNYGRKPKTLWTEKPDGELIRCELLENDLAESRFVASELIKLSNQGISLSDTAVFFRTKAQSGLLEETLSAEGVAYHKNNNVGSDSVNLMIFHAAKGLEFKAVFMVGMEERLFPHVRGLDDLDGMEEERRLCYVGMTRARERLYLLHTRRRMIFGQEQTNLPSRLLKEIPGELLAYGRTVRTANPQQNNSAKVMPETEDDYGSFFVGMLVRHARFGVGEIRKIEGLGDGQKVIVFFNSVGLKKLLTRFAGLERSS